LDDIGMASQSRVRQALLDYFTWATNTTMDRYHRSPDDVPLGLVMPKWSWDGFQT
jgi:hemoglobin